MFKRSLRMWLWLTLITGIVYPLFITLVSQLAMPFQANGSLLNFQNRIVGSRLIGQNFTSDKYFWGRPSAHDYNSLLSGGSNLGPISLTLKELVASRRSRLQQDNAEALIPSELLFASGSGLDPHITLEAALFQWPRIVKARSGDYAYSVRLHDMIVNMVQKRKFGFLGTPTLNVLELNLALDGLEVRS